MWKRWMILAVLLLALAPEISLAQWCYPCVRQGDLDLDGIPASIADLTLYDAYFRRGMIVFQVAPAPQVASSDVNCDGVVLSVADLVWMIRSLSSDSSLCCLDSLSPGPDRDGFPAGTSDFRVAVGDFVQDYDYARGYIPIALEQLSGAILSYKFTLELEAADVTVDSVVRGADIGDWNFVYSDFWHQNDTILLQLMGLLNYQENETGSNVLAANSELARIYVSYTDAAASASHRVRFYFDDCNDNGMTLEDIDSPGLPDQLQVSNRIWEGGMDITDSTSVYGGIDTCCVDTVNPNPPARAIDFVNNELTFPEVCCVGIRGDVNGDMVEADPVDFSYLVDYLYAQGPAPVCEAEGDINLDSLSGDPVDLAFLVDYLFVGGPRPLSCLPPELYDWVSYSMTGDTVAAGVWAVHEHTDQHMAGTFDFQPVGNLGPIGPQTGDGFFMSHRVIDEWHVILIGQHLPDNYTDLLGNFNAANDTFAGHWEYYQNSVQISSGTLEAIRR